MDLKVSETTKNEESIVDLQQDEEMKLEETEKWEKEFSESFSSKTPNELAEEIIVNANGNQLAYLKNIETAFGVVDNIIGRGNLTDEEIVDTVNKISQVSKLLDSQYGNDQEGIVELSYLVYDTSLQGDGEYALGAKCVQDTILLAATNVEDDKIREELINRCVATNISSSEYRSLAQSFKTDEDKIKYLKYALEMEDIDTLREEKYYCITSSLQNSEKKSEIEEYIQQFREHKEQDMKQVAQEVLKMLEIIDNQVSWQDRVQGMKDLESSIKEIANEKERKEGVEK